MYFLRIFRGFNRASTTTQWMLLPPVLIIMLWGFQANPRFAFDDAYITYRYADNLRNGHGLLYNRGEWVLGTTSPLFALALAVLGTFFADIESLGLWLGVFGWIAATWAAVALFLQLNRPVSGFFAGTLLALQPTLLSSLGMETPMVIALMLASAWAWQGSHRKLAGIFTAALLLTRLDGSLWVILLAVEAYRRDRRLPSTEGTITGLLLLPWFGFSVWRYGSFLPNSVVAKLGQRELMPVGGQSSFLETFWQIEISGIPWLTSVLALFFLLIGIWVVVRKEQRLWWLVAWLAGYLLIYEGLGTASFPWYFAPPAALAGVVMGLGTGHLVGETRPAVPGHSVLSLNRAGLHKAIKLVLLLFLGVVMAGRWEKSMASQKRSLPRYHASYRQAGQWLAQHTPEDATVATIEIGVLGYLSDRPILDTMGLVTPDMTAHRVGWIETLTYAINVHQPDYAVTLPGTAWDWLLSQWWFTELYKPVAEFENLTIYVRSGSFEKMTETEVHASYTSGFTLVGIDFGETTLDRREPINVRLRVEVDQAQPARFQFTTYFIDTQSDERIALTSSEPFNGGYPTSVWQTGDRLAVPVRMDVPADLEPGTYQFGALVYDPTTSRSLPLMSAPDAEFTEVRAGWLRLGRPPAAETKPDLHFEELETHWHEGITLMEVGYPSEPVNSGEPITFQLTWRTDRPISRDYTVFVHLVDAQGEIIAQQDQKPFNGRFPTPSWRPNELLQDTILVEPPAALNDDYGVRIGLYDSSGRLMLEGESRDYLQLDHMIVVDKG